MDAATVIRKREFNLVREADKIRIVLIVSCTLFLFASPAGMMIEESRAWTALALAAVATILTRFFVDWDRLEANNRVTMAAAFILIGDLVWLMLYVSGTGGFTSPFGMLPLIVILFSGVFFSSLPLAMFLVTGIVVAWFTGNAMVQGIDLSVTWALAGQIITTVAVGWLGYALTSVLERERQANEHIIRHLTEGVILLDAEGRIVLANPRIAKMVDLPEKALLGRHVRSILPEGQTKDLAALLADVRELPRNRDPLTRLVELEREEPCDLRVSTVPCRAAVQQPLGWVIVVEDITELRAAARMKEEGLAISSHELRSPLATLRAVSQVLESLGNEMDEDQRTQAVSAISGEIKRLSELVAKLLDVISLDRRAYTLQPEHLHPASLLRRVADLMRLRMGERQLDIVCEVAPNLPMLYADSTRLEMVLANLGENALKYTPEGGRVTFAAQRVGDRLHFTVSDTGMGISPHEQEVVFEKFSRGQQQQASEGRDQGLGLGLYVAKKIVELHGGEIRVNSQVGVGTTFEIILPAAEADSQAEVA